MADCPTCGGRGSTAGFTCDTCNGSGVVEVNGNTERDVDMLKTEWTFKGITYGFTYAVTKALARAYLIEREGVKL